MSKGALICFTSGTPVVLNDPEHSRQFVMSVVELFTSHAQKMDALGKENDKMHRKLQIHDGEMVKLSTEKEKMANEMRKLRGDNMILSRKVRFLTDKVIKLSRIVSQLLSNGVQEFKTENRHLFSQVDDKVKKNRKLVSTVQANSTSIIHVTELQKTIMKKQGCGQNKDIACVCTGDIPSKRNFPHSDTDILHLSLCVRKPTIWDSDQVQHKPACTVTEETQDLENFGYK